MKLQGLKCAAAAPAILMTVALLPGTTAVASSQTGHFTEVYVVDESGVPLTDENGHYYLLADDAGRLMSGSPALKGLFSGKLSEAETEGDETDMPSVNAVTADRYFYEGRFYEDAGLTAEITDLGKLLPGFVTGEMSEHSISFDETGETLVLSSTGYGAKGVLTSFDGVSRQVFAVDAGGAIQYANKLGYSEGRLYTDGSMSEQIRTLPAVTGLAAGEEAMYYIDGSDKVIVVRVRAEGGAAGFLADPYDPSFREPLFTTDASGIIRYLGNVTLYTPDGGGVQFFFDGDNILDGELNTAEDVAGLAPEREGMIFSGFFADVNGNKIPLTDKTGLFAATYADPDFIAWRDSVKKLLTDSRVTVEGYAEYCYEFIIPNGEETVSIYSDGDGWYAEEQLYNTLDSLSGLVAVPDVSPAHFAGFYLDADDGARVRLADAEGNFTIGAADAITAIGNRGGTAYTRTYRVLTLEDGDAEQVLYYDGDGYYADDALLESFEGVAVPEAEREEIYGFPVDEDGNELPHDDDAEPELLKTIVRTCVGYYLKDADGNLIEDEDGEPMVLAVSDDGSVVFDWSEAEWGDATAVAVWEEEEVYPENSDKERKDGGKDDKQAPDKKKKKTTKSKDTDDDDDEDGDGDDKTPENGETTEPEDGKGDAPEDEKKEGEETPADDTDERTGGSSDSGEGASDNKDGGDSKDAGEGSSDAGEGASDSDAGSSEDAGSGDTSDSGTGASDSDDAGSDATDDAGSGASDEDTGSSDAGEGSGSSDNASEGESSDAGSGASYDAGTGATDSGAEAVSDSSTEATSESAPEPEDGNNEESGAGSASSAASGASTGATEEEGD